MVLTSLISFIVFAVVDWVAVARRAKRVEYVAKPGALVVLLIYGATGPAASPWLLAALFLSLCGDVALMLPADLFVVGLAAFLLAHVAYIIDFEATVTARVVQNANGHGSSQGPGSRGSGTHRKTLRTAWPNQPLQATAKSEPRLSGTTLAGRRAVIHRALAQGSQECPLIVNRF